ncbi:MAG: ATP-dependent 6-phosphofructokinase [Deltaproteobacteria bacterium]|nr:ATP-dependent 6-phosphofructokinase [Deltaproteobacteria bacterium]
MSKKRGKRVGILTSGGDAPGMNAAVRAVFRRVKDLDPHNEVVLFKEGLNGLAGRLEVNYLGNIEREAIRGIIHKGGTFIGTGRIPELKPAPPGCEDVALWERKRKEITDVAVVNLRQLGLDSVVVVGGDGSFNGMSHIIAAYEERYGEPLGLVGLPGTIDNDIWGTEDTIGFDTALNNSVAALRNLRDTIESHRRCAILELMGNSSGWIALAAGIAGGATTIMIPERPESYDLQLVLARVRAAVRLAYRSIIIVMAEGVKKASGRPRVAEELRALIEGDPEIIDALGRPLETRINIIGYIARGGSPSARDNLIASQLGCAAADLALSDVAHAPMMVGTQGASVVLVPMREVIARSPRLVEASSPLWATAESLLVSADQSF